MAGLTAVQACPHCGGKVTVLTTLTPRDRCGAGASPAEYPCEITTAEQMIARPRPVIAGCAIRAHAQEVTGFVEDGMSAMVQEMIGG
jgi:hypothetical protein